MAFEHLIQDNLHVFIRADTFRNCKPNDKSFENGVRIGVTYAYTESAICQMLQQKHGNEKRTEVIKNSLEILLKERSLQSVENALNYLLDNKIIF